MRTALCFVLAVLCLGQALAQRRQQPQDQDWMDSTELDQRMTPFKKGNTFVFQYNAQIASGLIAQDESSTSDPQQKSLTRIQAQAEITFGSDRHAQLWLKQIRVGQLNEKISNPTEVKPLSIFEQKQIPSEKQHQLQQPCQFSYADGVIERVQFNDQDDTWSKNIKRAVLNMIQLNLKRNNAQGLQNGEQQDSSEEEQQQDENSVQAQLKKLSKTFSIPEVTVEGACQTTYTVNPQYKQTSDGAPLFNVTKSVDFKRCQKIADVAYGYQTEQQQPQCAQCQQEWLDQVQNNNNQNQQEQQQQQWANNPCAKCDPKEVKEQQLDRSTTLRYVLIGQPNQKYALKRTELLSQYVLKKMQAETGPYGSAMHTVIAASLQLRSVKQQEEQVPTMSSENDESLMFSNEKETDVKRFYMYGDEEFPQQKSSPFHQVPKVQQAEQALRKLAQASQDKQKGFEVHHANELQRLVKHLRQCTVQELKRVQEACQQMGSQQEKQKAMHIFTDALAIAGTRNCVQLLTQKIKNGEISQTKAIQALKGLNQLPAPSDQIVKLVKELCKNEKVKHQQALKQSCWLTFGALVNEVCQHKTQQNAQKTVFGAQSGFNKAEQCPQDKKKQYKEAMLELLESQSTQDKVIALTALGNAGLDNCVNDLEEIIKDKRQERIVRVKAIDALRRLRTQMPRKIQQILLPIFQNGREQPEVRTAAFAILMYTLPEQQVVDQLAYAISKEGNKQVQSFCYYTMKMMSRSKNPVHRQIAKHIKNALKLANVDEQQLRYSGKVQIPIFSQEQQEGLFISLAQTVSQRSGLPAYAHIQLDSALNDQFQINEFKLFMMQQEAEQWYQNLMSQYGKASTRGQRRSSNSDYSSSLRSIYSALGIKSRRSSSIDINDYSSPSNQQPFAMVVCRTNDVDHGFMVLDEQTMSEPIRQMLNGEQKPSLSRLLAQAQQEQQLRGAIAAALSDKQAMIPTSAGLPLRVSHFTPVLATIDGSVKVNPESNGLKAQINAQPMINLAHIQKMECKLPFLSSGVENIQAVEINLPIHAEVSASPSRGANLKVKLPQSEHIIFGAHSIPLTYTATINPNTKLTHEPRQVRSIQNPKLERMQRETNKIVGQQKLGIPMHIHAHYHWPSQPLNYQQFFQMLQATENAIHVRYQPNSQTPREAEFHISGQGFEKSSGHLPNELQSFYNNEFESAESSEEQEDMEMDSHSNRRQKLERFINNYQPGQQYKHSLKMWAQTNGGSKQCKAQAEVQAQCDSRHQFCKVQINADRTPMGEENQKWTLNAQAQLVLPETVRSMDQMEELSQKNDKVQCKAQVKWGAERKQQISVRIQGEQAKRQAWRQLEQQQKRYFQKRTAFINKFDLEADYSLNRQTQNTFSRCLELVKSYYFWNSQSQQTQNNQGSQQDGKVAAQLIIDPITQKHANLTVKTPTQQVRLQQIELPTQTRPFPLVRSQDAQSTNSFGQLFSRISMQSRPECSVDGYRVNTFDDADFNSPLSTECYSVLAKDCGSDNEPQFAVLMKALDSGKNSQKKLKVISQEASIECQPKGNHIQCKVNGQTVQEDGESESVEFNNAQKSDVTVHVNGVSVRFNGRKAWVKISSMYKNSQCGLCGHYDDSDNDEWRMSNGEQTQDLVEFHRSYTLKNSLDGEENTCSDDNVDQFYQKNSQMIRSQKAYRQDSEEEENEWDNEQFDGDFDQSSSEENDMFRSSRRHGSQNTEQPQQKTKVVEMNHQVCFSTQPVKQCPRGTVASSRPTSDYESDEDQDEQDDDDQDNSSQSQSQSQKTKKVQFACLSRSSTEARRLLRQVRNGQRVVDVSDRGVSFTEQVQEPSSCRRI